MLDCKTKHPYLNLEFLCKTPCLKHQPRCNPYYVSKTGIHVCLLSSLSKCIWTCCEGKRLTCSNLSVRRIKIGEAWSRSCVFNSTVCFLSSSNYCEHISLMWVELPWAPSDVGGCYVLSLCILSTTKDEEWATKVWSTSTDLWHFYNEPSVTTSTKMLNPDHK